MTLSPVGMLNPSHQLQAVWKVTPNITAARSRLPQRRASSRDQKLIASRRTAGAQRLHPAMRPGGPRGQIHWHGTFDHAAGQDAQRPGIRDGRHWS